MRGIAWWIASGSVALGLALPAAALGADTYVDDDTGLDTNPCTLAAPCKTVPKGVMAATDGATVHVDPDTYTGAVTVGGGKSLVAEDFQAGDVGGEAVIDGGSATALTAGDASTVSGFTLRANTAANTPVVSIPGSVTFSGNTVDVLGANAYGVHIVAGPATIAISDNAFLGDNTSRQTAIRNEGNNSSPSRATTSEPPATGSTSAWPSSTART